MDPNKASALTNLVICLSVVMGGFYWLREFNQKYEEESRFLFRAYLCWWLSWLVWAVVWVLITLQQPRTQMTRDLLTLAGSDLNAILLLIVYFSLTRGNRYKASTAWIECSFIVLLFFIGYSIFYICFDANFAIRLQEKWGLILGAVSTILVGWGFALRYGTRTVLIIGFIYGFAQPAAFEAVLKLNELTRPREAEATLVAVTVVLALLKVLWATVVTGYIAQPPPTTVSLVEESTSDFQFPKLEKYLLPIALQTLSLFVILITLVLVLMPTQYMRVLAGIGALGAFCTIVTGLVKALQFFMNRSQQQANTSETRTP